MSLKINHWCIVCGKGYHSCDSCNEISKFSPWQKIACTSNHFRIHQILSDYYGKLITKEQARKMLKKCDITNWENFKPNIKSTMEEILAEDVKEEKQPLGYPIKKFKK